MPAYVLEQDTQYVLNHCARYLARNNRDRRHDFGHFAPEDEHANICESWRFPIVDSHYSHELGVEGSFALNEVTFVYADPVGVPSRVELVGTFAPLYERLPLRRLPGTPYFSVTLRVPKGQVHVYRYAVDGRLMLDPINPQRARLDNGETWSRFFTQQCLMPITFERWEQELLARLTDHILPFRTKQAQRFLDEHVRRLDRQAREVEFPNAYRLDQSVGVVNFIDKLLAREEAHHREGYRTCLSIIAGLLRQRYPGLPPAEVPREAIVQLYGELAASGQQPILGWDYSRYREPAYFLKLLRRHTISGAFSHPKYGGNVGAVGWAFLEERYRDPRGGTTLFDWRRVIEQPLGMSREYRG
ncbi:MAG TPA: gluconate 2-dehydrogenase subunit 3 family protein [Myxococcus sp.]|nr:gluconate 2-dehydrogenase subunit 3 family protein [Myxococcus sp.]